MYSTIDLGFLIGSSTLTLISTVISIFSSLISAAIFIVNGIAVLNLCKKLSLPNGWLGFIPIANVFKIGQIANKCCEFDGKKKRYDKAILIPTILMYVLFIPMVISFVFFIFSIFGAESNGDAAFSIFSLLILCLTYLCMLAAAIVASVFLYIAYYKIFKIFAPQNAVLFIVLSIIISVPYILLLIASLKEPVIPQQTYNETANNFSVNN